MKMSRYSLLLSAMLSSGLFAQTSSVDLSGNWNYRLDPQGVGEQQKWFENSFAEELTLPGSLNTNGIGDDVSVATPWVGSMWNKCWYESDAYAKYREKDNTKIVFWLSPNKYYVGKTWYQKKVTIPADWKGNSIVLSFERCHWRTSLWVDGKNMGERNSLSVPHRYELKNVKPGKEYVLTVCVDNSITDVKPGVDSHSISDNTQSNWNGIVGEMKLVSRPCTFVENVRIEPSIAQRKIFVTVNVKADKNIRKNARISLTASTSDNSILPKVDKDVVLQKGENSISMEYDMSSDFRTWDEFAPNLYNLNVSLTTDEGKDAVNEQFGLREMGVDGTHITVNGRPVFFRGTLECCIFPKTGYPPTDEKEWMRIMKICKAHGLNHIRFHSWCPPEAAFNVADRLGMYLYVECGSWAEDIGSGLPIDDFIYEESMRIVDEYGNHPSFCLMSYGNEPHGKNHVAYLKKFVEFWKKRDNRFLYTTASGWPAVDESDWQSLQPPRIQGWGEGTKSIINAKRPNSMFDWKNKISKTHPAISHEIGQWCVYPDLKERSKYTGAFKAKNFDIFEDRLKESGLLHLADSFLLASGKLQTLCYKADIEAALRTDGFAGFQLLDLHDFPGQGTALVGVLNPFWESKGYVTPQEYSEFCNSVVPLAKMSRFVYTSGDTINAEVCVSQFSQCAMNQPLAWKITASDGTLIDCGVLEQKDVPSGRLTGLGRIEHVVNVDNPQQWELELEIGGYKNRWNLWAYPDTKIERKNVLVASSLDSDVVKRITDGGKVLLTPKLGTLRNEGADSVEVGFSSIFWNTLWTNGQAPHTLGILCNPSHPALSLFPTNYHSDYQWWDAMSHCNAVPLRKLGNAEPIVRIIDDWFTGRSFGLLVELKIGKGSVLLCGADLLTDADKRPEAVQLMNSLLEYMNSDSFVPSNEVSMEQLRGLFKD